MYVPTIMTQEEMETCANQVTLESIKVIVHNVMKIFMRVIKERITILFESSVIHKRTMLK